MLVVGISAFYHDSSVTLIRDGEILFAIQEERLTRKKHDSSFPRKSLQRILSELRLDINSIDAFVFYEKPWAKFERIIESFISISPRGSKLFMKAMTIWGKEKLFQKEMIYRELRRMGGTKKVKQRIFFSEHHLSHAASAFFPSPFEEALVVTIDGVGEWATTTVSIGKGNEITRYFQIDYPHSLGLLYSAFTQYCGFKVNSGEYKLMGLAPYGTPRFAQIIRDELITVFEDSSFALNLDYFGFLDEESMTNDKFHKLFGASPRLSETKIDQFHMDLAASIQMVIEEIILGICQTMIEKFGVNRLCLAGGVALNCVANGKILERTTIEDIWVQPAAGDAGGSLGAALAFYYSFDGHVRANPIAQEKAKMDRMHGAYLGTFYNEDTIRVELEKVGAIFQEFSENQLINYIAKRIAAEQSVGWFQGRMEFGPRALGNRSILADPRSERTQKTLNLQIKFRESFRPFAPSILQSELENWFEMKHLSPYMLLVAQIKNSKTIPNSRQIQSQLEGIEKLNVKRSLVPAVTHVDFSARIQTVHEETNLRFHDLISEFFRITGVPMLVNTSFNVRGEPIVESPADAIRCFMGTDIDILAIGNFVLLKEEQPQHLKQRYHEKFKLD